MIATTWYKVSQIMKLQFTKTQPRIRDKEANIVEANASQMNLINLKVI